MAQGEARRSSRGAVATAHPLATQAGIEVLERGGNAIDAANAAAAVLGVVQPMMSGLGGDSFILYFDASEQRIHSINGAGPAPAALTLEVARQQGLSRLPARGLLSAAVPGAPDAMWLAHRRFGSGRLSMPQLLARAIELAADGAPVAPAVARIFSSNFELLAGSQTTRQGLLIDGRAPRVGELLRQPELALTLSRLAELGPDDFYRGEFARQLSAFSQSQGGLFSHQDLAAYRAEITAPIATRFGSAQVFSNPPVAQGIVLLQALGILSRQGKSGAETIDLKAHRMIEALKLAFAQRNLRCGDPRFVADASALMLADANLAEQAAMINDDIAREAVSGKRWSLGEGDTTALVTADDQGNLVSYITSLSTPFGAAQIVPGTGVLLNNRAGRGFSLDPDSPNRLEGGKRTMSTLHAYIVLDKGGAPRLAGCTSGGDGQPQWNLQMIDAVLNDGADVASAVAMPRWELSPGSDPGSLSEPYEIRVDPRLDEELLDGLRCRGHRIGDKALGAAGAAQLISIDASGAVQAAADPRADGIAIVLN